MQFVLKKSGAILLFVFTILGVNNFCYAFSPEYHIGNHVYMDIRPISSNLNKKQILFLGSSVTRGAASLGVSFADLLEKKYGIISVKEAVDGTTLSNINENSYGNRLKKINTTQKFDAVVVQLSTNDAHHQNLPKDSIQNGIVDIVTYVRQTWKCPIVFYTNPYFENANYKEMVANLLNLSTEHQFAVIDFYNNEAWNNLSAYEKGLRMYDPIHPTLKGYMDMTEEFSIALQKIFKEAK
jgi:lysophospholipase L1-like esterase